MDKKERNSIVKAKLDEVLQEESLKEQNKAESENQALIDKMNEHTAVEKIIGLRNEMNLLIDILSKKADDMNEKLKKDGKKGLHIYMNWSKTNPTGRMNKNNKEVPFYINGTGGYSTNHYYGKDLMTELVQNRNSDNKRISKVCAAGLKLIFEGDEGTIKTFLEM